MDFWLCDDRWIREMYQAQYNVLVVDERYWSVETNQMVRYYRNLYWKWKAGNLTWEELETIKSNLTLLDCQNTNFTRIAFFMYIYPVDIPASLGSRIKDQFDYLLFYAQTIFDYTWPGARTGKNYLIDTLQLSNTQADYWLKLLVICYLVRFNFPIYFDDRSALENRSEVEYFIPDMICIYGDVPLNFVSIVRNKFPLDPLEFQDKLDEITYNAISPVELGKYTYDMEQQRIARAEAWAEFRKWQIICMAALIFLPIIIEASVAAYVSLQSPTVKNMSMLSKIGLAISAFASSIKTSISVFLTLIQFDTILSVHKIAFLVSEEYRTTMRGIYAQISSVSAALGFGPHFMALFLQNARNIVLTASTAMGMKYDLAQVQWLGGMHNYLKLFSAATYKYTNNPEALFFDLERWVERPTLDKKAELMQGILLTLRNTTDAIEQTVFDMVHIRDDLNKLVLQLPEKIRVHILPHIQPIIQRFDEFIVKNYDPYKKELDKIITGLAGIQGAHSQSLTGLVDRLKKPGSYLQEIDLLEDWERKEQERIVAEISSRPFRSDVDVIDDKTKPTRTELERIRRALEYVSIRPLLLPSEVEGPGRPAGVPAKKRETWFIGDY